MRVLITGGKGQLGREVTEVLQDSFETYSYGREEMDVTNLDQVLELTENVKPDVIIHTAAYTAVDKAESEPDRAFMINAYGTRNVAVAVEKINAKLVYISTDYIFDGTKGTPYNEFDQPSPIGVYGKSKYAGEELVKSLVSRFFIVRTSWVYGKHGNNFVKTMLKLGLEQKEIKVVDDQIGCPTYTLDLAFFIKELMETEKYGIYHAANSGFCSWYKFAKKIFELSGNNDIIVKPCTTEEFPRPAKRPSYSVLAQDAIKLNGFCIIRNWQEGLANYLGKNG